MTTYQPQAVWNETSSSLDITLNSDRPFVVKGVYIKRKRKANNLSGKRIIEIHVSSAAEGTASPFQLNIALREKQAKKAKIQVVELGNPVPMAEARVLQPAADMSMKAAATRTRSLGGGTGTNSTNDQMDED
ncbi:MAG: hypothetical protein AAFR61_01895 [Bacteroidota bacterium]